MKYVTGRHGITVIPETAQDVAFIEDTLNLRAEGDCILLTRSYSGTLTTAPTKKEGTCVQNRRKGNDASAQ